MAHIDAQEASALDGGLPVTPLEENLDASASPPQPAAEGDEVEGADFAAAAYVAADDADDAATVATDGAPSSSPRDGDPSGSPAHERPRGPSSATAAFVVDDDV